MVHETVFIINSGNSSVGELRYIFLDYLLYILPNYFNKALLILLLVPAYQTYFQNCSETAH